ncbi:MAG TPA: NRDE family protein, partial [Candidatus Dormibacteraeota bacterium]|nr:NRDE family protein [Candidatus Dormibacteraeota bacterium]
MCTILVAHRCVPTAPIVLVANRDERRDRPSAPPARLPGSGPPVLAGRDLTAGGTWLGCQAGGLVAALTNRRSGDAPDPGRRSRGHLPIEALRLDRAADATAWLQHLDPGAFNPFNLLVADRADAVAAESDGTTLRLTPLAPGVHTLTVDGLDALPQALAQHVQPRLAAAGRATSAGRCRAQLRALSRWHDPSGAAAGFCHHGTVYGTVST